MQNQPPRDHSWAVEGWEVEMKPMAMSEDIYAQTRPSSYHFARERLCSEARCLV